MLLFLTTTNAIHWDFGRRDQRLISKKLVKTFHSHFQRIITVQLGFSHRCSSLVGIFHVSYPVFSPLYQILPFYRIPYLVKDLGICLQLLKYPLDSEISITCCFPSIYGWVCVCMSLANCLNLESSLLAFLFTIHKSFSKCNQAYLVYSVYPFYCNSTLTALISDTVFGRPLVGLSLGPYCLLIYSSHCWL